MWLWLLRLVSYYSNGKALAECQLAHGYKPPCNSQPKWVQGQPASICSHATIVLSLRWLLFLPYSHIYSKIEYSLLPVLLAILNQALCFPALCEGVCKV